MKFDAIMCGKWRERTMERGGWYQKWIEGKRSEEEKGKDEEEVVEEWNDPIDWASIWNREELKDQQMLEGNWEIWGGMLRKNGNNGVAFLGFLVLAFSSILIWKKRWVRSLQSLFNIA